MLGADALLYAGLQDRRHCAQAEWYLSLGHFLSTGSFARELSFENSGLGAMPWVISLGNFRFRSFVMRFPFVAHRLETCA